MKDQLKFWIPIILFVATVIGWAYDNGLKAGRINELERNLKEIKKCNNEQNDFIKEQLIFNSRTATILELMVE